MAFQERKQFTFVSNALPEDTFSVVKFRGVEGLSRLYEFEITLVSDDPEIDLKTVLQNPAFLTISSDDQNRQIHGMVSQFEQLHKAKQHIFYRAVLVPRLWHANLYHENQIFMDKTAPDIIAEILKQTGLTTQDYKLELTRRNYPRWEYICQYRETHFDFISRWMEREGIYYFFEQTEEDEKLMITDSCTVHQDIPGEKTIPYSPPSSLIPEEEEVVKAFVCRQKVLPKKVILKDYNYRKPSLQIIGEVEVDSRGRGNVYLYGEHFKDPEEGNYLAKIRAEEILSGEKVFHGESTAPKLCPGFIFEMKHHYRDSYNQSFLITEVEHEGSQTGFLLTGFEQELAEEERELTYSNRFKAIPANVQFRPERKTPKPRFYGTINAKVDAAGDGKYAEIDDQGRYKVKLPFDLSSTKGGKASRWVRMAQPHAGADYGIHFPLHKGTEVLLTFVDGDPDRPVISGSVPNPETASPVTRVNQTKSVIRDSYGNEMVFDATPGDEHIRLYSPHHHSGIELGRSRHSFTDSDTHDYKHGNVLELGAGTKIEAFAGAAFEGKAGFLGNLTAGMDFNLFFGGSHTWDLGYRWEYSKMPDIRHSDADILTTAQKDHVVAAGDQLCLVGGSIPSKDIKSIINVFPGLISLSTGRAPFFTLKTVRGVERRRRVDERKELYNPKPSGASIATMAILSLFASVMSGFAAEQATPGWYDLVRYGGYEGLGVSLLGIIGAYIYMLKKEITDQAIEPVQHDENAATASIELAHKDQKLGIFFKTTKPRLPQLGVQGPQPQREESARFDMNHLGLIRINSSGQKKIVLGVGAPEQEDPNITIERNKINIKAGDRVIEINKDGNINILNPNGPIELKSQGQPGIKIDGSTVRIKGKRLIFPPNCQSGNVKFSSR